MRESANPQIHERPHGERAIVLGVAVLDRVVGIILKPDRSPRCRIRSGLQNCRACVPDSVEVNFELHNRQYTACYLAIDNLPSGILQFLEIDVTTWRFPPRLKSLPTFSVKHHTPPNLPECSRVLYDLISRRLSARDIASSHPSSFTRRTPRRHSRPPPPRRPTPRGNVGRRTPDLGRVPSTP